MESIAGTDEADRWEPGTMRRWKVLYNEDDTRTVERWINVLEERSRIPPRLTCREPLLGRGLNASED